MGGKSSTQKEASSAVTAADPAGGYPTAQANAGPIYNGGGAAVDAKQREEQRESIRRVSQLVKERTGQADEQKVQTADLVLDEAEQLFRRNDYKAALDLFTKVIRMDGKVSAAWSGRGGCQLRSGQAMAALTDLKRAVQLDPKNMFAMRDLAEAKFLTGDVKGALADYDKKLKMAPADGRALCGRADAKLKLGDKQGAVKDFDMAVDLGYPGAQARRDAAK